jgi:hypothetical protein
MNVSARDPTVQNPGSQSSPALSGPSHPCPPPSVATIRTSLGDGADGDAIRRLATLAATGPPHGAVVLAEVCGEPVAAVAIADGKTVADPARSTPTLLAHVRLHRLHVRLIGSIWGV